MHPVLVKLGPLPIHTFGVMLAIGILVGSAILLRETRRLGDPRITEVLVERLAWYMVLGVVLGGRMMYVIVELFRGNPEFSRNPLKIFAVWEGGLVMYGGLLAVFAVVILFARKNRISIWRLCDLAAPPLFIGDAIGRWGCFFAGDDYGRPTSSWVGIRFTHPESLVPLNLRGVSLHPTQIYMSAKALIIALTLFWISRRKKFDGQVTAIALMMYAILRSIVEYFRGDEDRGSLLGMSTAQFTSIFVFAVGVAVLFTVPRKMLADDLADPAYTAAPRAATSSKKKGKKKR